MSNWFSSSIGSFHVHFLLGNVISDDVQLSSSSVECDQSFFKSGRAAEIQPSLSWLGATGTEEDHEGDPCAIATYNLTAEPIQWPDVLGCTLDSFNRRRTSRSDAGSDSL
jgi:hypothetical protein